MKIDDNALPNDPEQLKQMLLELQHTIEEKDKELAKKDEIIHGLLERYELARRKQFGKSSEQHPGAGETFNEAEVILDEADRTLLLAVDNKPAERVKNKPKRKPLPKALPRNIVTIDIPVTEQVCDCCHNTLHKIGEARSEKLEFVPAHIKVIETVRPKYACKVCENTGTANHIKIASMPLTPIPKGIATASLLSQIITAKYQYGLPLYRQETLFNDHGIKLSRQTMSDWLIRSSELLVPLYKVLKAKLLAQSVIHADETPLKVIQEEKTTSYMWVYCCGEDKLTNKDTKNIVLFDYQNCRAAKCPIAFLDGYSDYLQVDGYICYEKTEAMLAGCMAHARRKFIEAKTAQGKNKTGKADVVLNLIGKLYDIEAKIKTKSIIEKQQTRQEKSKPIIDKINHWITENKEKIPPKTKLGEAITYWYNQTHKLETYLKDGRINIDNNRAERAVKPFVIGRKNWLFSNTSRGANASAVLYSIVETAKANGLIVHEYLSKCLQHIAEQPDNLEPLLPWNITQNIV